MYTDSPSVLKNKGVSKTLDGRYIDTLSLDKLSISFSCIKVLINAVNNSSMNLTSGIFSGDSNNVEEPKYFSVYACDSFDFSKKLGHGK